MTRFASDVLEGLAFEAVQDVFHSYSVSLTRLPSSDVRTTLIPPLSTSAGTPEAAVAGFIGFSGSHVRGAVLLAATFELVARARPTASRATPLSPSSSSDWLLARDWAGELVNQVLGRIKNRMRSLGIKLEVSAPAALSGHALAFAKAKSERTRPILFDAHPDRVWFWLDAQWDEDVEAPFSSRPPPSKKEGDVILFGAKPDPKKPE